MVVVALIHAVGVLGMQGTSTAALIRPELPIMMAEGTSHVSNRSYGPYAVKRGTLHCDSLPEATPGTGVHGTVLDVYYPQADGERFPVVSYLHGGDTPFLPSGKPYYSELWRLYASWGYVLLGVTSCLDQVPPNNSFANQSSMSHQLELVPYSALNCVQGISLPSSPCDGPVCLGRYHQVHWEALKCAKSARATTSFPIDAAAGATLAGHSLGAEATVFAAAFAPPDLAISAVVLHHYVAQGLAVDEEYAQFPKSFTFDVPCPNVPILLFTGTADGPQIVGRPGEEPIFERTDGSANETAYLYERCAATGMPRGWVNRVNATHNEPADSGPFNPMLGLYSVAWSTVFRNFAGRPHAVAARSAGVNWTTLIFSGGRSSVCGGGDGQVANCTMDRGYFMV